MDDRHDMYAKCHQTNTEEQVLEGGFLQEKSPSLKFEVLNSLSRIFNSANLLK